jgi:hypothetical protein
VCEIVGAIHFSPGGIYVVPRPSNGYYSFVAIKLACAGTVAGVADMSSNGTFAEYAAPTVPNFDGSFETSRFTTGNSCNGHVHGNRVGALVSGQLDSVNCSAGTTPGFSNGFGAVEIVIAPYRVSGAGEITDAYVYGRAVIAASA